jgi:hypothetical protein
MLLFSYLDRMQGVLEGVPRGHVGPLGPLELAALINDPALLYPSGSHGARHSFDVLKDLLVEEDSTCTSSRFFAISYERGRASQFHRAATLAEGLSTGYNHPCVHGGLPAWRLHPHDDAR